MDFNKKIIWIFLIFYLIGFTLSAQTTYNWLGGNGNWNTSSKWTPVGVPGIGDTAIVDSGAIILNSNTEIAAFLMHGGELKGNRTLTISDLMQWSGGLMSGGGFTEISNSAALEIFGSDLKELNRRTLNNFGSIVWSGTGTIGLSTNGRIINQVNATFDIQNDATIAQLDLTTNSFENSGLITKSAGSGVTMVNVTFNNLNRIEIQSGTLSLNNSGTDEGVYNISSGSYLNLSGTNRILNPAAVLMGTGTIMFSGDSLINNANINPGTSQGIFNVSGNLPLNESATVNIEIGGYSVGTGYDRIVVSDTAIFNGTLNATLINGFVPALGDTFKVISYSDFQGELNHISSSNFGSGLILGAEYTPDGLVLIVDYKPVAVDDSVLTDEDTEISFDVLSNDYDPGNDSLFIFSFTQPSNGTVTQISNGMFSFVPDSNYNGMDSFTYIVSDTKSGLDTANVFLEIVSVNDIPVITSIPDPTAVQDQLYTYQVVAINPDLNDTLIYSFITAPVFLNIDPLSGLVSGTPASSDTGVHLVEIRVEDSFNAADTQSYQLTVSEVNYPPVISSLPPLAFNEDDTLTQQISDWFPYVDDPNDPDNFLSYFVESGRHVTATPGNLVFNFYAPANWFGLDTLRLIVSDGFLSDTSDLYVSVSSVNDVPDIISVPDPVAVQDQPYFYQVMANDPDIGDVLTYSFNIAPGFLSIDSLTGLITGTPTNADTGMHSISIKVEDSFNAADTQNYQLMVTDVNYPPVLYSLPPVVFTEDDTLTYPISNWFSYVNDPDDPVENLSYVVESGSSVVAVAGNLLYYFTAPSNWYGLDTLRLIVSDGFSSDAGDLYLVIESVNDIPLISLPGSITFRTDSSASMPLWDFISDVETPDSQLVLQFFPGNDSLLYNYESATGMITFSAQSGFWGDVYINVTVTDDSGATAEDSLLVQITNIIDDISELSNLIPKTYKMFQNYPNPFNPTTKVNFDIPKSGNVSIVIFNVLGQKVATLLNKKIEAGSHFVEFDGRKLSSGIYYYQIKAGDFKQVKRMILLK